MRPNRKRCLPYSESWLLLQDEADPRDRTGMLSVFSDGDYRLINREILSLTWSNTGNYKFPSRSREDNRGLENVQISKIMFGVHGGYWNIPAILLMHDLSRPSTHTPTDRHDRQSKGISWPQLWLYILRETLFIRGRHWIARNCLKIALPTSN